MEKLNPENKSEFRKGALILAERFGLLRETNTKKYRKPRETKTKEQPASKEVEEVVNAQLTFELKTLESEHAWFEEQGILPETISYFGLGFCSKGFLKGRIAVPLHDDAGNLVGYAGILPDPKQISKESPEILFPEPRVREGVRHVFDRTEILYGAHLIRQPVQTLLVTDDFLCMWRVWQAGFPGVVCKLSDEPEIYDESIKGLLAKSGLAYVLSPHTSP